MLTTPSSHSQQFFGTALGCGFGGIGCALAQATGCFIKLQGRKLANFSGGKLDGDGLLDTVVDQFNIFNAHGQISFLEPPWFKIKIYGAHRDFVKEF